MLAAGHRFHGYNSLRGVYQRGQTVRAARLSLRFVRRDPRRPYRAAVVVSRKVHKSAVTRNRIRRRVYEAVRRRDAAIQPGLDMVFTVFDERLADLPAPQLQAAVDELLQRASRAGPAPDTERPHR